jgi:rhamnosyltransferase
VIAVINAIDADVLRSLETAFTGKIILNADNLGLAHALNQGLKTAFEDEAIGYALLLDQDSRPDSHVPAALRDAYRAACDRGLKPACVGPRLEDVKQRNANIYGGELGPDRLHAANTIATSGSVIGRAAYMAIGAMRHDLFIDGIDHEWCFRARSLGYQIFVAQDVVMSHDMGEIGVSLFGRYRPVYKSPFRHFYIVRNTLYLARLSYLPLSWRIVEVMKLGYRIPAYVFISDNKLASIGAILRAFAAQFSLPKIEAHTK